MFDALFSGDSLFFSIPAVAGTVFFVFQLVLSFVGVADFDADLSVDSTHLDAAGADPHHSTALFKLLSIQSIAAFLMGFGWGGLGGLRGARWEFGTAIISALVGGVLMVWLLTWLLKIVHDLQSTGTISIRSALDAEGDVYVTIPPSGKGAGQVRVIIDNRQRTYNAISEDAAIPTNARVKVARVNDDNTLTVRPL
jgi:hypothetical protein